MLFRHIRVSWHGLAARSRGGCLSGRPAALILRSSCVKGGAMRHCFRPIARGALLAALVMLPIPAQADALWQACQAGDSEACLQGSAEAQAADDVERMERFIRQGCELGNVISCGDLGGAASDQRAQPGQGAPTGHRGLRGGIWPRLHQSRLGALQWNRGRVRSCQGRRLLQDWLRQGQCAGLPQSRADVCCRGWGCP